MNRQSAPKGTPVTTACQSPQFNAAAHVETCLAAIEAREAQVRAWAHLDADAARQAARASDARRAEGRLPRPLEGVAVGLKDIIDTADMPTENGTPLDRGRRPERDAELVTRLRAAGAIVLGKTVTTELAVYTPAETTNPHDAGRTPGGSSSGSAAAVAAGMVPLAVGTQTNGSVIRPAAFCGVVGYKPTRGTLPRAGVVEQSPFLDQLGVFATTVTDAAAIAAVMAGTAPPRLTPADAAAFRLGFVETPKWHEAEASTRARLTAFAQGLPEPAVRVALPTPCEHAWTWHRTINAFEIARAYAGYLARDTGHRLSPQLRAMIAEGLDTDRALYEEALSGAVRIAEALDPLFDRFDALVTPAAVGEAPIGLSTTGDPVFCTPWTLAGLPAITLPLLEGPAGMPIGVQLVGRAGKDADLLRVAQALEALGTW